MGFFKRKIVPDILDLRDLQKRGLLPESSVEPSEDGIVDFSNSGSSSEGQTSNVGDFLNGLAGVGASSSSVRPSPGPITSGLRTARQHGMLDSQVNEMKIKLEDNDFKINNLSNKVLELENKIRELSGAGGF